MFRRIALVLALATCCLATGCEQYDYNGDVPAISQEYAGWDSGKTLLVFTAPNCAPCQRDYPAVQEIERQGRPHGLKVIRINGEAQPKIADEFGVREYPTYVLCEDGEVVQMSTSVKVILWMLKFAFKIAIFFLL